MQISNGCSGGTKMVLDESRSYKNRQKKCENGIRENVYWRYFNPEGGDGKYL